MIEKKVSQVFILVMTWYVSYKFFGLDLIMAQNNPLFSAEAESGVIIESYGFLFRVNERWFGLATVHDAPLDSPVVMWGVVGAWLYAAWKLVFDWESHSE